LSSPSSPVEEGSTGVPPSSPSPAGRGSG
jgi:hypothetical protein